jgi:hypothetical protein
MKLKALKQVTIASVICLLSFSSQSGISAESIPDIYRFVPADNIFTLDIKTSEKAWEVISKNKSLESLDPFDSSGEKQDGLDIFSDPELKNNLVNVIFSFSEFDPDSAKVPFTFIAELKNQAKKDYLKTKIKKANAARAGAQLVESAYKDADIFSIIPKDTNNYKFKPAYYVLLNKYFIQTNDLNSIQDSVKSYYNPATALHNSVNFARSYGKLGTDFQMQAYINMKKLARMFPGITGMASSLKSLNNGNLFLNDSMMVNLHLYNKQIELRTYTIPDISNSFMKQALKKRPSTFRNFISYSPKDSLAFLAFSDFNFNEYFSSVLTKAQAGQLEKLFRESLGLNLQEIYSNIKDDTAFTAFNTQANPLFPGFAVFLTPKDKVKMLKTLNAFRLDLDALDMNMARGNRSRKNTGNPAAGKGILQFSEMKTYKNLRIAVTNEIPELVQAGIRPAYTIVDGKVIIASNEEVMKSVIDRVLNNAPDFTLEKNSNFESIKKYLGSKNNSFGYINLDSIISTFGSLTAGKKDSADLIASLKKFHAVGFNSINDQNGMLGRILILADVDQLDFDKLFPNDKRINLNKSNKTF